MALTRIKNAALDPSTDITADQLDVGQLGGRRNLIINGAMQVWQRGTSGLTTSGGYTADRWWMSNATSIERSTDAPEGFSYSLKVNTTNTNTSIGQPIELVTGSSSPMIAGETVTLSFYAKTDTGTDDIWATIAFRDAKFSATNQAAFGDMGSTITTAWQRFTSTFTVPNINATNVLAGLVLYGIDGDIYITGVQLEVGSVATPFEHRSYGEELALCQRYYQFIDSVSTAGSGSNLMFHRYADGANIYSVAYQYFRPMRAAPSITFESGIRVHLPSLIIENGTFSASNITNQAAWLSVTPSTTNNSSIKAALIDGDGTVSKKVFFDAEL